MLDFAHPCVRQPGGLSIPWVRDSSAPVRAVSLLGWLRRPQMSHISDITDPIDQPQHAIRLSRGFKGSPPQQPARLPQVAVLFCMLRARLAAWHTCALSAPTSMCVRSWGATIVTACLFAWLPLLAGHPTRCAPSRGLCILDSEKWMRARPVLECSWFSDVLRGSCSCTRGCT